MFTIKKFNNISDAIYESLPLGEYKFVTEGDDYEAAIVRSADLKETQFPPQLCAIARAGAGVNNIPLERCSEQGVVVFNTPGANANAVKELVICALLLSCRRIVPGIEWVERQDADVAKNMEKAKKNFVGSEIAGKTLGVVGLGAVGVMVANAAAALGMNVLGCDPYLSVEMALRLDSRVQVVKTNDEIFKAADFITLHVPENDSTRGMINKDKIALMKNDVAILNFARGGLVVDEDILEAVDNNEIDIYITDFPNDKINHHDRIIAMPHLGASTPEAEENCAKMAAAELKEFLTTGSIRNSVNFPACELPAFEDYRITAINRNVPNMLGQMTAALTQEDYNIEHLFNRSRGDWAYTVIDVNKKPTDSLIAAINAIDGVVKVRVIE
ncbi:MAG: phosphoglycerate dehydrogenase [Firmicutes bacterium]|nr:phosphoglycerate dehydrogenase [Bacillota bacterium]MBR3035119.1 phosphoglycerate dehydrogenase [Bacillota bacterium]MBR6970083.1 phosphoglycerate dehydrogenase [Bacillota bacterium]